jgi:hypothetical protein
MRSTVPPFLLALVLLAGPAPAAARAPADDDVRTLDAIVDAFYAVISGPAGAVPDLDAHRHLTHPEARVGIIDEDAFGRPSLLLGEPARLWAGRTRHGPDPRVRADWQRETSREVRHSGAMAQVWSAYEAGPERDGPPTRAGVYSIGLFNDGRRWWITSWMTDSTLEP